MSLADELNKLDGLRTRGVISDAEFNQAKQRLIEGTGSAGSAGSQAPMPPVMNAINAFRRSTSDKWIGGVCGGLALATGLETWAWRLIAALLALAGGTGLVLYLLLWLLVPTDDQPAAPTRH